LNNENRSFSQPLHLKRIDDDDEEEEADYNSNKIKKKIRKVFKK